MVEPSLRLQSRNRDWLGQLILLAILLTLFADAVFLGAVFPSRDLLVQEFPLHAVVRNALLSGHFPYWDPTASAGQPLAANPEYELFYPPSWLVLLPGFPYGMSLLIVFHLALGWIGVFRLCRELGLETETAVVGALAFGLSGLYLSATNLPPAFFGMSWLPWILLFAYRAFHSRRPRDVAFAALALGMQFLIGEPTFALETVMLVTAVGGFLAWRSRTRKRSLAANAGIVTIMVLGALCLAAVQLIPAADFLRDTVRGRGFAADIALAWSFPPIRLPEIAIDRWFGPLSGTGGGWYWGRMWYQDKLYPYFGSIHLGIVVISLALASFRSRSRWHLAAWSLAGLFLLLSFGSYTPLFAVVERTPLGRVTRYPEKFLAGFAFILILIAAAMFERVLRGDHKIRKAAAAIAATLALLTGLGYVTTWTQAYANVFRRVWSLGSPVVDHAVVLSRGVLGVSAACALAATALWIVAGRVRPRMTAILTCAILLVELGSVSGRESPRMPRSFLSEPPALETTHRGDRILALADIGSKSRVYQEYVARVRTADDELYLTRNALGGRLANAWGRDLVMERDIGSTSLKPTADFVAALPRVYAHRGREAFGIFMEMSGASDVTFYRPFGPEWKRAGGRFDVIQPVQVVPDPHPFAYFARALRRIDGPQGFVKELDSRPWTPGTAFVDFPAFDPSRGAILASSRSQNEIDLDVESEGKAFLVICETPHRYWHATIDGKDAPLRVTNVGYQGLVVEPGEHHIRMTYRNPLIIWSGAISIASLILVGIAIIVDRRSIRSNRGARDPS